ncbi:MAG TPA: ATP-binding protein, partial [Clostridiaceae bacterium]|nr:ATP-binding protein [Clostridiaceae bacterium]
MSDCATCGSRSFCNSTSEECTVAKKENLLPLAEGATVKHVVGIYGAKGGVGTTLITAALAAALQAAGRRVAVIDAAVCSPDLPIFLGSEGQTSMDGEFFRPQITASGIQILSFANFMADASEPLLWESSMMAGVTQQFWCATLWDDVDIMLIDLPSQGGSVPLQLFASLPFETIFLVSTGEPTTLLRCEQARNFLDWNQVPCGGLIYNKAGTRGEA